METQKFQKVTTWQQHLREAITSLDELCVEAKKCNITFDQNRATSSYPLFIPKILLAEIFRLGPESILWKQFIPSIDENIEQEQILGLEDPIGDLSNQQAPQLIHRYENRVLFLPTQRCPIQCRYCFRKNELHNQTISNELFVSSFNQTMDYLQNHDQIEEIIFTGGDPLMLKDEKINFYLEQFSTISSIKFIRFHTRFPAILPSRLDDAFFSLLERWRERFTLSIMIHTNSVSEFFHRDHSVLIEKIRHSSIHWGSQTVLLKHHQLQDLVELFKFLGQNNIRPYYLHQMDRVLGGMHFVMPKDHGQQLYVQLRQKLPGWLIPHYVVDSPSSKEKRLVLDQH